MGRISTILKVLEMDFQAFIRIQEAKLKFQYGFNHKKKTLNNQAGILLALLRSYPNIYRDLKYGISFIVEEKEQIRAIHSRMKNVYGDVKVKDLTKLLNSMEKIMALFNREGIVGNHKIIETNELLIEALNDKDYQKAMRIILDEESILKKADLEILSDFRPLQRSIPSHTNPFISKLVQIFSKNIPLVRLAAVVVLTIFAIGCGESVNFDQYTVNSGKQIDTRQLGVCMGEQDATWTKNDGTVVPVKAAFYDYNNDNDIDIFVFKQLDGKVVFLGIAQNSENKLQIASKLGDRIQLAGTK